MSGSRRSRISYEPGKARGRQSPRQPDRQRLPGRCGPHLPPTRQRGKGQPAVRAGQHTAVGMDLRGRQPVWSIGRMDRRIVPEGRQDRRPTGNACEQHGTGRSYRAQAQRNRQTLRDPPARRTRPGRTDRHRWFRTGDFPECGEGRACGSSTRDRQRSAYQCRGGPPADAVLLAGVGGQFSGRPAAGRSPAGTGPV